VTTVEQVERVVAPVVASSGLELVDVEVRPGTVRVTVDRAGGVDLDVLGAATSAISHALDQWDAVGGGSYELEVSSPGLERRLRRPEHFQHQVGSLVSIRTKPGVEGERRLEGRLVAAGPQGFRLEAESIAGGSRELAYAEVDRAHTVFDWRAALAGTQAPSARRQHKAKRQERQHKAERQERQHGADRQERQHGADRQTGQRSDLRPGHERHNTDETETK
jgi:ribosome maturation factor RimP